MIIIPKLRVENFQGVEFAECNLERGTTLITGNNGSSKTTLWIDAVLYLLYGISRRYGAQPGKKVVYKWWSGKLRPCLVTGPLDLHGQTMTLIRARNHPDYADGLTILGPDGKDLSLGKTRDSQAMLTKWLGMSSFTFRRSVMVESDVIGFPDASEADRRRIIDDLLDIGTLNEACQKAKDERAAMIIDRDLADEQWNGAVSGYALRMDDVLVAVAEEAMHAEQAQADLDAARAELEDATADSQKADAAAAAATKRHTTAASAHAKLDAQVTESNRIIAEERERISGEAARIQAEQEADAASRRKAAAEAARWKRMAGTVCSTCQQSVTEEHALGMAAPHDVACQQEGVYLAADVANLAAARTELQEAEASIAALIAKRTKLRTEANNAAAIAQQCAQRTRLASQTVQMARRRVVEMERTAASNPHTATVGRMLNHALEIRDEIIALADSRRDRTDELRRLEITIDCLGPQGARASMLAAAIPFLNTAAANLQRSVRSRMSVHFSVKDGVLIPTAINPDGAVDYEGNSRGEKVKIDKFILFCLLALARSRGSKNFGQSFYDESIDGVDPEGQAMFEAMLVMAAEGQYGCYIISHDRAVMADKADRIVHMDRGRIVETAQTEKSALPS